MDMIDQVEDMVVKLEREVDRRQRGVVTSSIGNSTEFS